MEKGGKFDSEKGILIFDSTLELTDTRSPTERTANLIASIANTINSNIQVTVDTPECDSEGRLPVLDMKVWCDSRKILHTFYKKPVSSKFIILRRSAILNPIKISTTKLHSYNMTTIHVTPKNESEKIHPI